MENLFALIEDNVVTNIIVSDLEFADSLPGIAVDVTNRDPKVGIGNIYDGSNFTTPESVVDSSVPDQLFITLSDEIIGVGFTVDVSIELKDVDGVIVPLTGTYYAPIMRESDGFQADFIAMNIVDGIGSAEINVEGKGKFILDVNKVTPEPTAEIMSNPSFIVV